MGGIFDINRPFYQFFAKIFWAILFNFVFILTSIPIITVGASYAGLYGVFLHMTRDRVKEGWFKFYFQTFGKRFIPATVYWLLGLVVMVVWALDIRFFVLIGGTYGIVATIISIIGALVSLMVLNAAYAVMVQCKTGIKDTWKKTIYFLRAYPVKMFFGAFWFLLIGGIVFTSILFLLPFSWLLIMVFGLIALACSYCYNTMFIEEEDEEEIDEEEGRYSADEISKYADMTAFLRNDEED